MNPTTVRRPRTMQEIADSVMQAGQAASGRSMEEIAAEVLGQKPLTTGEKVVGGARALLGQGLGLEFGDEIEAGIRAIGPRDYRTIRDEIRSEQDRFTEAYPKTSLGLQVSGGALPALGALVASGGTAAPAVIPSLGARMARGAVAGFGTGAIAGAGAAPEMADIPRDAGIGAAVGTAGGALLPAAFRGVGWLGGKAADVLEGPIRALAETAPPKQLPGAGGNIAGLLGAGALPAGEAGVGPTRAAAAALMRQGGQALETLRNAPGRAAQAVLPTLENRARNRAEQKLLQALIDDGLTPEQAAQRMAEMQARGAPAAVADVGEENLLELTNVPYLIPGEGRRTVGKFFADRVQGTSGRLAEGVEGTSGAKLGNVNAWIRSLDEARKPPAKALYERAYEHGAVQLNEDAVNILLTKDMRDAWFEGLRRSRLDAFTDADKRPLAGLFRVGMDQNGERSIELIRDVTVRDVDVVKRGIDAMINKAIKQEDDDLVRLLTKAKNTLVGQVDAQAPAYREARQFWGGVQGLMNALEDGKRFLRGGADDFADKVASLTPDELRMYRAGAANAIAESLRRREGRAVAINILTDPTAQQRLRVLYPDEESFNALADLVQDEVKMAGPFARMSRQSQTAQNFASMLDFASDFRPGDIVPEPKSMALRALAGLANAGQQGAKTSSAAQLARLLTQQGPEGVAYLRGLQQQAATQAARSAAASRAAGRTSGIIGGSLNRRNQ